MKNYISREKTGRLTLVSTLALSALGSAALVPAGAFAQTGSFANPAFKTAWQRTDQPVLEGKVARTWVWGPTPGHSLQEPFKEGQNGTHLVQYFDKARMEINNPSGNPA